MPSKKRVSTTNAEDLATLATKLSKKSLTKAMHLFMEECQPAAHKLLNHLQALEDAEVDIDEKSRISIVIDTLVKNRPIVAVNLEGLPTYRENPDFYSALQVYNEHFKTSKQCVSLVSVVCFGKYVSDAISASGISENKFLTSRSTCIEIGLAAVRNRLKVYKFLQQYPMFVNSNIGFGFLVQQMAILKDLFCCASPISGTNIKPSTNYKYDAWCSEHVSDDELHVILSA